MSFTAFSCVVEHLCTSAAKSKARLGGVDGRGYRAALHLARHQGRHALLSLSSQTAARPLCGSVFAGPASCPDVRPALHSLLRHANRRAGHAAHEGQAAPPRQPRARLHPRACLAWCGAQGRIAACCSEPASSRCRTCAPHQSMCCTGLTRTGPATRQLAWQAWWFFLLASRQTSFAQRAGSFDWSLARCSPAALACRVIGHASRVRTTAEEPIASGRGREGVRREWRFVLP